MKREAIFILLTVVLSFNSSAVLIDDFQDGDCTANPAWVIYSNLGSDTIAPDPHRPGNLSYKAKGTSTGDRIRFNYFDFTMPWNGFDLSYEFLVTANDYHLEIGVRGNTNDKRVTSELHYRTGWSDVLLRIDQTVSAETIKLSPSDIPVNHWLVMHCWHDPLTDTIFQDVRRLDTGELIAEMSAQAIGNFSTDVINKMYIGVERNNWQYVDNIYLSSERPDVIEIEIIGPDEVPDSNSAAYTAIAYYEDASTADVTSEAIWSVEPDIFANIDKNGLLTTQQLYTPEEIVWVSAQYTKDEISFETDKEVVIFANCSKEELINRNIKGAVQIKERVLSDLELALSRERTAEGILRDMQRNRDITELSFRQIVRARIKIVWAIIKEMWSKRKIIQSKEHLEDSLDIITQEPDLNPAGRPRQTRRSR